MLRANVGLYRESQISSEKSNFGLYHPNNPLVWLFQKKDINKSPGALHLENFRKVRKFTKNTIFIHEISQNFEQFQRNCTGAKKILLTSSSLHIKKTSKALRLCKNLKQNSFVNIIPGPPYSPTICNGVLNVNFSHTKSILVCFKLKNQLYCMKEWLLYLQELKCQLYKLTAGIK